jgi:hypothetical protein
MEDNDRFCLRRSRGGRRLPASVVAVALAAAVLSGLAACKPGDGATGVNPPADTRRADQAPSPDKPRQP